MTNPSLSGRGSALKKSKKAPQLELQESVRRMPARRSRRSGARRSASRPQGGRRHRLQLDPARRLRPAGARALAAVQREGPLRPWPRAGRSRPAQRGGRRIRPWSISPRFVRLAKAMGVGRLDMLATAAVRDASERGAIRGSACSGAAGCRCASSPARRRRGSPPSASSPGMPDADGMMGDLGGGSLELVGLDRGKLGAHVDLAAGPLARRRGRLRRARTGARR